MLYMGKLRQFVRQATDPVRDFVMVGKRACGNIPPFVPRNTPRLTAGVGPSPIWSKALASGLGTFARLGPLARPGGCGPLSAREASGVNGFVLIALDAAL